MCSDHFLAPFFREKEYNMCKKHFLAFNFLWKKYVKTFFELFFNKNFLFVIKTIICDWDYFLCVKDLLLKFKMILEGSRGF